MSDILGQLDQEKIYRCAKAGITSASRTEPAEFRTAKRIEEELDKSSIPHSRVGETGVLGILRGTVRGEGVTVLRARRPYSLHNSTAMNDEVKRLHEDEDVQKSKGIYEYLLCREIDPFAGRLLNLRAFDKRDKMAAYSKQNGICPICGQHFEFNEMEGDHIKPWSKGGHTTPDNCQMLCKDCNSRKTDKY